MAAERIKKNPLSKTTARQAAIIAVATQHPNLSQRQIAKITNTDHAHVSRTLQTYGITEQIADNYVSQRAKIYQGIQAKILSCITAEDIEKASLKDKCVSAGILHDHERIELGQSTDKQPVLVLVRGDNCHVTVGGGNPDNSQKPDDPSLHNMTLDITPPAKCAK